MKQSAAKTLGTAALGAAFAAAAAGSATAAPAAPAVPDVAGTLSSVTSTLPVQEAATKLPAGAPEALLGGQNAITGTVATLPATVEQAVSHAQPPGGSADPVQGLLGGLPAGAVPGVGG